MKLEELKAALESGATKENKQLKEELENLKADLEHERNERDEIIKSLVSDCKALANRCWALTHGTVCIFCRLSQFRCEHYQKTPMTAKNERINYGNNH